MNDLEVATTKELVDELIRRHDHPGGVFIAAYTTAGQNQLHFANAGSMTMQIGAISRMKRSVEKTDDESDLQEDEEEDDL